MYIGLPCACSAVHSQHMHAGCSTDVSHMCMCRQKTLYIVEEYYILLEVRYKWDCSLLTKVSSLTDRTLQSWSSVDSTIKHWKVSVYEGV